ncbi:hypothetical protein [Peribacillus kribbensis]|uniref:hypothetical protein n=1 Tax=Peribacillus kribbensis TaxID=356658 RepID=UPI0003F4FDFC|nr:hypothetical protein [Peribacillus kribbensis]
MKKLLAAIIASAILFTPVGSSVFQDHQTVEAKGYKSGKRSFQMNGNTTNRSSYFQNKKQSPVTSAKPAGKRSFFKGGLMKTLMIGGLAGFLFGSLFAHMGMMGSLLGLLVNILAIYIVFSLIRTIFSFRNKNKRNGRDSASWRN